MFKVSFLHRDPPLNPYQGDKIKHNVFQMFFSCFPQNMLYCTENEFVVSQMNKFFFDWCLVF